MSLVGFRAQNHPQQVLVHTPRTHIDDRGTLPERPGRWQGKHQAEKRWVLRLEFTTFVQAFVALPCHIVRTGRKLVYRLLAWNPYQSIFFRLVSALRC